MVDGELVRLEARAMQGVRDSAGGGAAEEAEGPGHAFEEAAEVFCGHMAAFLLHEGAGAERRLCRCLHMSNAGGMVYRNPANTDDAVGMAPLGEPGGREDGR